MKKISSKANVKILLKDEIAKIKISMINKTQHILTLNFLQILTRVEAIFINYIMLRQKL